MVVYVVSVNDVSDFETFVHTPKVFKDKVDALKEMKTIVDDFRDLTNLDDKIDGDSWIEEKNETHYEAYIDGRYAENHYEVDVDCVEVE